MSRLNIGQLFYFSFLNDSRFLIGVHCHPYSGKIGMLARFFAHCPSHVPSNDDISKIVGKSTVAFSSIGHVGGFRTGFYTKCGLMKLSNELAEWPQTFSSKMWPFPSRLLVVDPLTGSAIEEAEVEDNFFHPMIPNNGFGAIETNRYLADHYWEKGLLVPLETM